MYKLVDPSVRPRPFGLLQIQDGQYGQLPEANVLDLAPGEKPQSRRRLVGKQRVSNASVCTAATCATQSIEDVHEADGHIHRSAY